MELETTVKNALSAFEAFKTDLAPKMQKLDGLDIEKLNRLEKSIGDAMELTQKEQGKVAALEAEVKAMATLVQRPGKSEEKEETQELITKAFNEFARSDSSEKTDFRDFLKRNGKEKELKALSVNVDSNGGYLVQPTLGGIVTTKIFETSPMRQLANIETISSDSFEIVVDYDEVATAWAGEVTTRSDSTTPALGKIIIPTHEVYTQPKATQKLLDDAAVNVESWLAGKVADAIGRKENTAFITGTGATSPRGIMSYDSGTTISSGQVQQVNAGSTSSLTYAGLVDLQNALKEVYQANATFLMKRATFGNAMKVVDGQSRPIFNLMFEKNTGLAANILGRPVVFADDVATISSASLSVAYGDFKQAYTIVDRIGLRTLRDPYTAKPYVVFYTTKRTGGAVVNFEAFKIQKMS